MITPLSVARICVVLTFAFFFSTVSLADSPPASPLPPASPAMLQQLGPELNFEGYGIRIPAGYVPLEAPKSINIKNIANLTAYSYTGGPHADDVCSRYTVGVATSRNGNLTYADLGGFIRGMVRVSRKNFVKIVYTKPEYGTKDGMPFECIHYGGGLMVKDKPIVLHGFAYAFLCGTKMVVIIGEDSDPYSSDSLPVMLAATSTLRRLAP